MHAILVLALASSVGIEVGWEPLSSGGHEYTIQLEPQLLDILKRGSDVVSEVPAQLSVRRYRITIGTGKLPRIDGDQPPADPPLVTGIEDEPIPNLPESRRDEMDPVAQGEEHASAPEQLDDRGDVAPLPAAYQERSGDHSTQRPALKSDPPDSASEPAQPWMPFLIASALLCCSLGGNAYLGWIAWEARARYRSAVARLAA